MNSDSETRALRESRIETFILISYHISYVISYMVTWYHTYQAESLLSLKIRGQNETRGQVLDRYFSMYFTAHLNTSQFIPIKTPRHCWLHLTTFDYIWLHLSTFVFMDHYKVLGQPNGTLCTMLAPISRPKIARNKSSVTITITFRLLDYSRYPSYDGWKVLHHSL